MPSSNGLSLPTITNENVIPESIKMFHQYLSSDDLLLDAFEVRGSLRRNGEIFPSKTNRGSIDDIYEALEAIDRGDATVYRQNDPSRAMVVVGAEQFACFREHMKTSEALKYDAAAFAVVAYITFGVDLNEIVDTYDTERTAKIKAIQEQVLNTLLFEVLRLEYESKTAQTKELIGNPSIPRAMTDRAEGLLSESWDSKKDKSLAELHGEMTQIKNHFDAIHQMLDARKDAYVAAKSKLDALIADDSTLTEDIRLLGVKALNQAKECEERQNMPLAYDSLRGMLLECCDTIELQIKDKKIWLNNAFEQFSQTINTPDISEASKIIVERCIFMFEQDRKTKSFRELVERADALLLFKSTIERQIKTEQVAYKKLRDSSSHLLAHYDVPVELAAPLRDELTKPTNDTRALSEKSEALKLLFKAADDAKQPRQIKEECSSNVPPRYTAVSKRQESLSLSPGYNYNARSLNSPGLFNHSTQNQYKNKQLLLGIGLILLGAAVLSITIMSAIATFGASAPLAGLALPLSMSLAASGMAIIGAASIGVAATGGYVLSK